ncbi:MAG: hypothetical protein ACRDWV_10210, partial [Acidimicrobiales bacterium]
MRERGGPPGGGGIGLPVRERGEPPADTGPGLGAEGRAGAAARSPWGLRDVDPVSPDLELVSGKRGPGPDERVPAPLRDPAARLPPGRMASCEVAPVARGEGPAGAAGAAADRGAGAADRAGAAVGA